MIRLDIPGQPPRKSNSRRIVTNRRTGKPMLIKSEEALAWLEAAQYFVPPDARHRVGGPDKPLRVTCWVRYKTRRPDLSIELIKDFLEEAAVISNDRYIFEEHNYKEIDRENPGVTIEIEEL